MRHGTYNLRFSMVFILGKTKNMQRAFWSFDGGEREGRALYFGHIFIKACAYFNARGRFTPDSKISFCYFVPNGGSLAFFLSLSLYSELHYPTPINHPLLLHEILPQTSPGNASPSHLHLQSLQLSWAPAPFPTWNFSFLFLFMWVSFNFAPACRSSLSGAVLSWFCFLLGLCLLGCRGNGGEWGKFEVFVRFFISAWCDFSGILGSVLDAVSGIQFKWDGIRAALSLCVKVTCSCVSI